MTLGSAKSWTFNWLVIIVVEFSKLLCRSAFSGISLSIFELALLVHSFLKWNHYLDKCGKFEPLVNVIWVKFFLGCAFMHVSLNYSRIQSKGCNNELIH